MRILVIGKNGQLARSLAAGRFKGVEILCVGRPELDLTDGKSIDNAFSDANADVVINAAAYTAVDQAETEEAEAIAVNARGAEAIAAAAARHGLPLIHVSTDYVFDGELDRPYNELDAVAPVSAYGRSKLAGERAVTAANTHNVIVRTAWLMSPYGKNFCKTMLRLAQSKSELSVVSDQVGSPTYVPHLAAALIDIAKRLVDDPGRQHGGVYHLVNQGHASWFDVATFIMSAAAKQGHRAAQISAISSDQYPTPVRRPVNSRLDCSKAKKAFDLELPHWMDGIDTCVEVLTEHDQHDDKTPKLEINNAT